MGSSLSEGEVYRIRDVQHPPLHLSNAGNNKNEQQKDSDNAQNINASIDKSEEKEMVMKEIEKF